MERPKTNEKGNITEEKLTCGGYQTPVEKKALGGAYRGPRSGTTTSSLQGSPQLKAELTSFSLTSVGKWKDDLVSEERIVYNSHRPTAAFQTTEITKGPLDGIYAAVPSYYKVW